jgi:Domain of unknown function (DUF5076)
MGASKQLPIPEAALRDKQSYEIARVWVAEKAEHVSLMIGSWEDPMAWGIVLADLVRHVALGYEQDKQMDPKETVRRICSTFLAELNSPTDEPKGNLMKM